MVCPCFIAAYAGFCSVADIMYVPSIEELEHFCFTRKFGVCELFKNSEAKTNSAKSNYDKVEPALCIDSDCYKEGSKDAAQHKY
jgi:hypothetical protein